MLTPRQQQVVERVGKGMSNKAIARDLGIAVGTVEVHVKRAAERIPGDGRQRYKLMLFFLTSDEVQEAA